MESVEQLEFNFVDEFLCPVVVVNAHPKTTSQHLLESLGIYNPDLAERAAKFVGRNTKGLDPDSAELIGEGVFRSLLNTEESSRSTASVLLTDRARYLMRALDYIAASHSLLGLSKAIDDPKHMEEMINQFKDSKNGLRRIQIGAKWNRRMLLFEAKHVFALAVGERVLVGSGLFDFGSMRAITRREFDDLETSYYMIPYEVIPVDDETSNEDESVKEVTLESITEANLDVPGREYVERERKMFNERLKSYLA